MNTPFLDAGVPASSETRRTYGVSAGGRRIYLDNGQHELLFEYNDQADERSVNHSADSTEHAFAISRAHAQNLTYMRSFIIAMCKKPAYNDGLSVQE